MGSVADPTAVRGGSRGGRRAPAPARPRRRILPGVLLVAATVLAVGAIASIWVNRVLLNPDNWASTSTRLLHNGTVRRAAADYLVARLYQDARVDPRLESALPKPLSPAAGPLTGALRSVAIDGAVLALRQRSVQNAWRSANREADRSLVALVNGGDAEVGVDQGVVRLHVGAIMGAVAAQLGLGSGLHLAPDAASITVLRSDQLRSVQDTGRILQDLPLILVLVVVALYLAAIWIARDRRREQLGRVGCSLILAGLAAILIRALLVSLVPGALTTNPSVMAAVGATVSIATAMLVHIAWAAVAIGVALVLASWIAGPMRWAVAARRLIAPLLCREPVASYAIAVGVLVLVVIWRPIEALGRPLGIVIFAALGLTGVALLRRQVAREFPAQPARASLGAADRTEPTGAGRR